MVALFETVWSYARGSRPMTRSEKWLSSASDLKNLDTVTAKLRPRLLMMRSQVVSGILVYRCLESARE